MDPRYLEPMVPLKSQSGLFTSQLGLRFQLRRRHFVQGHISLKCTATIYSEYFQSTELYLPGLGLGEKALESRRTNGETLCDDGLFSIWHDLVL